MNPVEQIRNEYAALAFHLQEVGEISLLSDVNKNFRKVLILSAGSFFEHQITSVLTDFALSVSKGDRRLASFLERQAINQKYHQLFSWGEKDNPTKPVKNANTFWKLFGDDFKSAIEQELRIEKTTPQREREERESITAAIEAFVELGHLRNILVHSNFADYNYDHKTTDEIFELFQRALPFVDFVKEKLS